MRLHRLRNYEEFLSYRDRESAALSLHQTVLSLITPKDEEPFKLRGFSYVAGEEVMFEVDFQWSGTKGQVNWRDRVSCPKTGFTNRWRATAHLFDIEMEAYPDSDIYITEQVTPLFAYFSECYPRTIGSEYLRDGTPLGHSNDNGIRNEDLCALTFPSESFDIMLSFDVIEHIPEPSRVFPECYRILRVGGRLQWTVPFSADLKQNITRATMVDGIVEHLLPAEYHGDPLSENGVLCFTNFGWQMLEDARAAGFRDVYAVAFHSAAFGYHSEQFQFFAIK